VLLLSGDDLLDFEVRRGPFDFSPRTLLDRHGDAYRYQLVMAWWLEGYRDRRAEHDGVPVAVADAQFEAGALETLGDIAANLRHGDFLPGGSFYEEAQKDARSAVVGVRLR
jgi:hypothetical protein